ncbi:PaeR7I family type II restriction endonuclease [Kitasatospora viridis]|uniref:Type II restriction enzyme n=1 Tax=Kitasatospora viridis TaxID=281105 RepID=A0A561UMJ3_9ACTN|nr:PaeR7I family type II restriction endonuclease [Kitasatospora viridis]TWG00593.1 type II restriction enzyme [Kitasatospora viridis]
MRPGAIQGAVEDFWFKRNDQREKLDDKGKSGGTARANKHMGGFEGLVKQVFVDCGLDESCVLTGKPYLPGFYRVRKQWDLVVLYDGILVAALEFKSQVGSVSRNINNRFEEALGTATDTAAAQNRNGAFGDVPPWLGYVLVLREDEETEQPDRDVSALFETDPVFKGHSYNQRYQEMIRRLIGEKVYDAGWFLTTTSTADGVAYKEPLDTATGATLRVAIEGRVNFVKAVVEARRSK